MTSEPWFPGFLSGTLALIGVIVASIFQNRREKRNREAARVAAQDSTRTPAPPTTQQVWDRLDKVERVLSSSIVLLGEVADQWQGEHPPVLSRKHVAVVAAAGYMPVEWEPEVE